MHTRLTLDRGEKLIIAETMEDVERLRARLNVEGWSFPWTS
jgi:hypothetical protein